MTDKLYVPSNSDEAAVFYDNWCCQCARDRAMREGCSIDECDDNEKCQIITEAFVNGCVPQWIYDERGKAKCTDFIAGDLPIPVRCSLTKDMFDGA
jgi:hypothetical protein